MELFNAVLYGTDKDQSVALASEMGIDLPASIEECQQIYRLFSHRGNMQLLLSQETPSWMPTMPRYVHFSYRFRVQDETNIPQQQQVLLASSTVTTSAAAGSNAAPSSYQTMLRRRKEKAIFNAFKPIPQVPSTPRYMEMLFPQAQAGVKMFSLVKEGVEDFLPQSEPLTIQHEQKQEALSSYELPLLGCHRFDDAIRKKGYVIHAGGSIHVTEWVPGIPAGNPQYLLVAGSLKAATPTGGDAEPITAEIEQGVKGCLQLWRFPPLRALTHQHVTSNESSQSATPMNLSDNEDEEDNDDNVLMSPMSSDPVQDPVLEMCILHEYGTAWRAQWCPSGSYMDGGVRDPNNQILPRLGIVAVAFGDGSLRAFVMPHPLALRESLQAAHEGMDLSGPLHISARPMWSADLPQTKFTSFAWSNQRHHRFIAAGSANGHVSIWDMQVALSGNLAQQTLLQLAPAHDSSVRDLKWCDVDHDEGQQYFVTCGSDGRLIMWDIQNLFDGIQLAKMNAPITEVLWSRSHNAVVWAGPENLVRWSYNDSLKSSMTAIVHDSGILVCPLDYLSIYSHQLCRAWTPRHITLSLPQRAPTRRCK
jgi:hypothetical protein